MTLEITTTDSQVAELGLDTLARRAYRRQTGRRPSASLWTVRDSGHTVDRAGRIVCSHLEGPLCGNSGRDGSAPILAQVHFYVYPDPDRAPCDIPDCQSWPEPDSALCFAHLMARPKGHDDRPSHLFPA